MSIIQKINSFSLFRDAFHSMGRSNQFSESGLEAIFEYLDSMGEDIELDVIGICCEFSEYESLEDFNNQNQTEFESIDEIENMTTVIRIDSDSFVAIDY